MRLSLFIVFLLGFTGCSQEKTEEASKSDHIIRSQIDAMNQAKEVRSLVQKRLDEQQQESEAASK